MSEQIATVTMRAEPDGPPASNSAPEYRELAAEFARQYALTGNEAALSANLQRLAEVAVRHGAAKLYEQERIDRDRRNDTFMSFINHPAYPTAYGVVLELAHADRTAEEIRTVLDIIGETPTMDETAGEMAVALFRQGHPPTSVALLLLNAAGVRGRA